MYCTCTIISLLFPSSPLPLLSPLSPLSSPLLSSPLSPPLPSLSPLLSSPPLKGANVQKAVRYIFRYTLQKQLRDTLVSCINSTCTYTCALYNCTHVIENKQIGIFMHVYDFYYARNFLSFLQMKDYMYTCTSLHVYCTCMCVFFYSLL